MKNTDDINDSKLQDLINQMTNTPDQFNHLQIFMSRTGKIDYPKANEFLMVTPSTFGKVKILDLNVENDIINIKFLDCGAKAVGSVGVDINDDKASVLFICWSDVKDMVFADMMAHADNSELLGLCSLIR